MLIACVRLIGQGNTAVFVETDGNWDLLKIKLCKEFDCERLFNEALAWDALRGGRVVTDGSAFFQIFDAFHPAEGEGTIHHFTAFQGDVLDIVASEV